MSLKRYNRGKLIIKFDMQERRKTMVVKVFESAQSFLNKYEKLMLEHEAVCQLILFDAYHNLNTNADESCLFGSVLEDEIVILLFCNVTPYNLVIYAIDSERQIDAAEALADYISGEHIPITGINGKNEICESFIDQYKKVVDCTFKVKIGMDIMEIRKLNDIKPVEGKSRNAKPSEAKLIADWIIQFQIEAMISEMDYEEALNKVTKYIEQQKIFVYENTKQKIVTMAIATRNLLHGIAISYVYTPEEFKGKGYAAANIYYMCMYYLENGNEFCTIFADKENPITYRAYEKVGFQILEDNYDYIIIS